MELSMEYQSSNSCAIAFTGTGRQAVATDFTLPDYCSDIERILRCGGAVQLHTISENAGHLHADGEIDLRLLYLNEEGQPDLFEQHLPLSVSLQMPDPAENGVLRAHATIDYLNCHARSPRKISLNGSVSVQFEVLQSKEEQIVSSLPSCESLSQQIAVSSLVSLQQRTFDLSETVSLPAALPPVEKLIRADALPTVQSVEAVDHKLLVKGSLQIDAVYLTQDKSIEKFRHTLPISQVLEVPGVTAGSLIDLSLETQALYVQTKRDGADEMRLLDLAAKLSALVRAYENRTLSGVIDCYATNASLQPQTALRSYPLFLKQVQISAQAEESMETGVAGCEVLDAVVDSKKTKTVCDADSIEIETDVTLLLLLRDPNGNLHVLERNTQLHLKEMLHLDADDAQFSPAVNVSVNGVHVLENGNLKADLLIQAAGNLFAVLQNTVVTGGEILECDKQPDCQLILYFGKTGELLWPIAKRYRSTVGLIRSENNLSDNTLAEDRLLMIPTVVS